MSSRSTLVRLAIVIPTAGISALIACSNSSPGKIIDAPGKKDAAGSCQAAASYSPTWTTGTMGTESATNYPAAGSGSTATPHIEEWDGVLSQGTLLDISLFAGFGAFTGGDVKTGSFTVTGSDTKFSTCGLCLTIYTDLTSTGSGSATMVMAGGAYTAASGTVDLTSVGTNGSGNLTGTLSNVVFQHVSVTNGSNGPQPGDPPAIDSCKSTIGSASFSAPLTPAGSGGGITVDPATGERVIHLQLHPTVD